MNLSTTIHWLVGREMQETEEEVHIVQSHKLVLYGGSQSDSDDMTQKINSGVLLSPFTAPLHFLTPALCMSVAHLCSILLKQLQVIM